MYPWDRSLPLTGAEIHGPSEPFCDVHISTSCFIVVAVVPLVALSSNHHCGPHKNRIILHNRSCC